MIFLHHQLAQLFSPGLGKQLLPFIGLVVPISKEDVAAVERSTGSLLRIEPIPAA